MQDENDSFGLFGVPETAVNKDSSAVQPTKKKEEEISVVFNYAPHVPFALPSEFTTLRT